MRRRCPGTVMPRAQVAPVRAHYMTVPEVLALKLLRTCKKNEKFCKKTHAELTIRTFSQTARNTRKRDSDPKLQTPFVDRTDPDKASRHLDILPVVMSEQKKISTACLPLSEQQPPDFTLSCSFC